MRPLVTCLAGTLAVVAAAGQHAIRFVVVTLDPDDAQPAHVYMPNSADGWKSPGREVPRVAPGVYVARFEFDSGRPLEYKFTREAGWASVEKNADGSERANRSLVVDAAAREQTVVCAIARWADREPPPDRVFSEQPPATQPAARPSTITGDVRRHEVESPQLGNTRTIVVWLPPGYEANSDTHYPVLYMHDGQNVFDAATSFLGVEWRADETAAQLIAEQKIEPLIIVGIYNTAARAAEYSPFPHAGRAAQGDGDKYLAFIIETVKPLIDRTYRTRPDRENTALAGSSLGGLISIYAMCRHPDVFGKAAVISPALWFGDRGAIAYAREHPPRKDARIWVDVGTEEGDMKALYVSHARELVALLESQGLQRGRNVEYLEVAGAIHRESAWADRFGTVLMFLFPRAGQ